MRNRILLAALGVLVASCRHPTPPAPKPLPVAFPSQFVNSLMGTGGFDFAAGNDFAGASVPNGMMRVGPDTSGPYGTISFLHFDGYWYGDDTVLAFTHLHLNGTGSQDYGVLGVLPVAAFDPTKLQVADYQSTFQKSSELATPGYYALTLDNGNIKSEMTTTTHASHERYTFDPSASTGTIFIDLSRKLTGSVTASNLALNSTNDGLTGDFQTTGGMSGGFHLFFAMKFKRAFTASHVWADGAVSEGATTATGTAVGVALDFGTTNQTPVELQVGLSMTSSAAAQANLDAEMSGWDFTAHTNAAQLSWDTRLKSLTVYGGTVAQRQTFYSALHHTFVMPGVYSDEDGKFLYRQTMSMASGFQFVNDISGWDVYRTLIPLYSLIAPDMSLNLVQSELAMAKVDGQFPKWPLAASDAGSMVGSSADIIVADAYARGVTGFDVQTAYKYLRDAALDETMPTGEGRGGRGSGTADYLMYGYLLHADGAEVSVTCEYSMDDFALGNLASALGNTADAMALQTRSLKYQALFDPTSGFLRGRNADGSIETDPFNPGDFADKEFVESDEYQSQFCIEHDIDTFASMWGGKAKLAAAMETLFENSKAEYDMDVATVMADGSSLDPIQSPLSLPPTYYFAGNEPDIYYTAILAQAGRPDLADKWIVWTRQTFFAATPEGIPGNDDGGTMAALYVWDALGLYPVPGSDVYVVGTPMFPQVDIAVPGGTFSVVAQGVSDANIYVQSATLNGAALNSVTVHQADLKAGGSLKLVMGPKASGWAQSG